MNQHEKFMREALKEARLSLDKGEFPVGCLLVADGRIVARDHRKNSSGERANELDHAEVVTLRRLFTEKPGTDCSKVTIYSTMEPCLMCYSTMLLSGVRNFVWAYEDVMGGGMNLPLYQLNMLYARMKVVTTPGVCRSESLQLFQEFFQKYSYWQGSLLARYTLAQDS